MPGRLPVLPRIAMRERAHCGWTGCRLVLAFVCLASATAGATAAPASNGPATVVRPSAAGAAPAPPPATREFADWVATTGDNDGMPYVVIDKSAAQVSVFDATGRLQASAPALLGLARGDRSVPGVGAKKLSAIRPQERITPAGRFVASLGHDLHGQQILWIDYPDAIALHPVVKGTPQERRGERLASATTADNRISYGCINVPRKFYDTAVSPAFAHTSGIVYILPETGPARGLLRSRSTAAGAARAGQQP